MRRWILDLWPAALLLLLWQIWVSTAGYNSIVMVPPGAVASDLVHSPGAYAVPALHTLAYAMGGLCLGMMLGVLLALAAWRSSHGPGKTTRWSLRTTTMVSSATKDNRWSLCRGWIEKDASSTSGRSRARSFQHSASAI